MFEKRLIHEIPEAKKFVFKQVLCQWLALLTNVIITIDFCFLFVLLVEKKLTINQVLQLMVLALVVLCIRAFFLKKASRYSFEGASLVKKELRKRLFEKVLMLSNHYQDYVSTSELVQLSVEGINQLETYFALYLPQLFYSLLAPLTLFLITVYLDWKSALVLLVCVPLIPVSIVLVQKFAKKLLAKYWQSYTTLGDSFLENLQGLTTLKIYQSDDYKQKQMNIEAENFRRVTMRVLIMQLNSISVMDIVAYGGAAIGSYMALSHLMNGSISLFAGLFIILMSFEFFIPLRQLGSFFHIAMNGIAASDKIFKVLDIENQHQGVETLHDDSFSIEYNHLSFCYGERQVLKDIQFSVDHHQWVGIVGESGSGKSTLAKLLMGYHQNYTGQLLVQGKNRKDISDQSFLEHFMYITHNPMIFKGTLRENLDFEGKYSDEQIWKSLKKVCLDAYFQNQEGLQTQILESGSNLSGGQKQRLNLARALLRDSDVYIFDEATSHIDVESEENILKVMSELAKEKTVLFITHRLSTVVDCHKIVVLKDGELVEQGSHEELFKQAGVYYHMYQSQKELEVYNNEKRV